MKPMLREAIYKRSDDHSHGQQSIEYNISRDWPEPVVSKRPYENDHIAQESKNIMPEDIDK